MPSDRIFYIFLVEQYFGEGGKEVRKKKNGANITSTFQKSESRKDKSEEAMIYSQTQKLHEASDAKFPNYESK